MSLGIRFFIIKLFIKLTNNSYLIECAKLKLTESTLTKFNNSLIKFIMNRLSMNLKNLNQINFLSKDIYFLSKLNKLKTLLS
jgi:hypothetical protein